LLDLDWVKSLIFKLLLTQTINILIATLKSVIININLGSSSVISAFKLQGK